MSLKTLRWQLFSACMLLIINGTKAQNWNPAHAIGTATGVTHFSYSQTPDQLVELYPAAFSSLGYSYRWESGTTPLTFTTISGATNTSYTFSAPLTQTTYYRRRTTYTFTGEFVYSNVIKIQVVSTSWEDRNYVREHNVRISGQTTWQAVDGMAIGDKLQTTSYMDGLGRSVQQISKGTATPAQSTGTWGDMVQFSVYDQLGREPKQYLPYTTTTEAGKFKTGPVTAQAQYYSATYNETSAFSQIQFESSPLNRVKNIKAPGEKWAASAGNSAGYETNTAADGVQQFAATYVQGSAPVYKGAYPDGTLYKAVSTDENGKKVIEYTDKSGQLILRKVQLDDSPASAYTGWICTYSVYDDFGQLRFQLQPEAVKYLAANSWSFAGTNGTKVLAELCFQYFYDEKGRNTWKKAPGADPLVMVYDGRDRVVFMQDGNQRIKSTPEWTATLYDELDRPVITTLYNTTKTVTNLQSDITNASTQSSVTTTQSGAAIMDLVVPSRDVAVTQYAARNSIELATGFESESGAEFVAEIDGTATEPTITITASTYKNPISNADLSNASVCTILKYQFYDGYAFSGKKAFQTNFENSQAYSFSLTDIQPIALTGRTLGFPTGSRVRVLGTTTFLNATSYFDERGAPIQMLEDNHLSGTDATTLQYHFDGRVMSSFKRHSTPGTGYGGFAVLTKNSFDKLGRITGIDKRWGSNAFQSIAEYSYDDMGRLKTKRLAPGYTGSDKSEMESLTYSYNLHNLLTGINKDYALKTGATYSKWNHFFGLYLGYDNRDGVFAAARLNGQVGGALWNTQGDDHQRKYDFTYDNAGRLSNALFNERPTTSASWSRATMDFSVTGAGGKIGYDLNGNLLSMIQKGVVIGSTTPVNLDDLQYSYSSFSNKLMKVTDASPLGANNGKQGDFKDGANGTADDYVYDANGNLVIDLNKNVKDLGNVAGNGIRYNFLDKPEEIRIAGKGTIKLQYDAEGNKLRKTFTPEGSTNTVTTAYVSGYVYQETVTGGVSSGVKLQFISFEEGRIRPMQAVNQNNGYDFVTMDGNLDMPDGKRGAIDFYIRDYQENVRMILTEETHIGSNQCTMETARASSEEPLFGQSGTGNEVVATRFAVSDIPGQSTGGGWQNANIGSRVSRIGSLAAGKVGPNALLKVMGGDRISSQAEYYYQTPVVNGTGNNLLSAVLGSLINSLSGSPVTSSGVKEGASNINTNLSNSVPFGDAVAPDANNSTGDLPKAYLNILFFNERFEFVKEGSTAVRVQGSGSGRTPLQLLNIRAPKNGYCYVYLSNEAGEHVYFDNFKVTHNRGRIIEENHYYAYGLRIQAISSKKLGEASEGHLDNKYQYQGAFSEMDEDIGWNDFALRNYDPQLGRWVQQDPYQQFASPYVGMGDDPVNLIDPTGGFSWPPPGMNWAIQTANQASTASSAVNIATSTFRTVATLTMTAFNVAIAASERINTNIATRSVGFQSQFIYKVGDVTRNSPDDDLTKTYYPSQKINTSYNRHNPYDRNEIDRHERKFTSTFRAGTMLENIGAQNEASSLLLNFQTGKGAQKSFDENSEMSRILSNDEYFIAMTNEFEEKVVNHLKSHKTLEGFYGVEALTQARRGKYIKGTWFMHTVMGGFAEIDATVSITSANQISIRYTIWDHFGAGRNDAVSSLPGLPSMYWLQHNSATNNILMSDWYTPFIWNINFSKTVNY